MRPAESNISSVMISALNTFKDRDQLPTMLMPELQSRVQIDTVNHIDFDLMTDEERFYRIRDVLTSELRVDSYDSYCRKKNLVEYRQLFSYFLNKYTGYTLESIGRFIGKNHSTVIHSIKRVKGYMEWDKAYRAKVELIDGML